MNYYNPYSYMGLNPYMSAPVKMGLFSKIFGGNGLTLSSIMSGTQKAIGFANQAIPLVKQVTPVFNNAKTMFKVMNEFKKVDTPNNVSSSNNAKKNIVKNNLSDQKNYDNGPTFFI
ncbi:MAG: VrrA/YqfQ family protein [Bacilli bacterium]|nr:VrrA/YqfQ family protein [Bacilli bacterium]